MGRRMTPAKQEQLTPSCFPAPSPCHCPHSSFCCCFGRRGIIVTPLHFPSWHPPPRPAKCFTAGKEGWAVAASFVKSCSMSIFSTCWLTKLLVPLTPVHGSNSLAWLRVGGGGSDWSSSLILLAWFSHKGERTPFCMETDSVTSHSFFQPQDSIGLLESSGQEAQCDRRLLGTWNQMKMFMGVWGHQTISDCKSFSFTRLFLWVFLSVKCLFIFLSLFTPFSLSLLVPSQLNSSYIKAGQPHSFWYPPL